MCSTYVETLQNKLRERKRERLIKIRKFVRIFFFFYDNRRIRKYETRNWKRLYEEGRMLDKKENNVKLKI